MAPVFACCRCCRGVDCDRCDAAVGADDLGGFAACATAGFYFEARQNRWKSDGEWKDFAASLVGRSWSAEGVTVTFGVNGVATAKLKVGSNTFTGSATLNCPGGVLYIYFAPNTKKKFKGAVTVISVDPDVVP